MAALHPFMEGGGNGVVSYSRQGRPVLKLGVPLSTSPFNTACYNLTKSVGIRKIFRHEYNSRIGLGTTKWDLVSVWLSCLS